LIRKKIEKKYAKALFDILLTEDEYAAVFAQLKQLQTYFDAEPGIYEFLTNPINELHHKMVILEKLEQRFVLSPLTINFIAIIMKRQKLVFYAGIMEELNTMHNNARGILHVEVTSAIPLNEATKNKLIKSFEEHTGKKIILSHTVDSTIIGGLIARIDSVIYDSSIKKQLELIRNSIAQQR
jgi:F-type H+-transporting ATPase subunit delta